MRTDLGCHAVLLHERLTREVELQRVVRGDGEVHAAAEEVRERVARVVQEERVIAERRDGDPNLAHVE